MERLKEKGVLLSEAIRYDWGTSEVRLSDIEGNEIVIVEFAWLSTSHLSGRWQSQPNQPTAKINGVCSTAVDSLAGLCEWVNQNHPSNE